MLRCVLLTVILCVRVFVCVYVFCCLFVCDRLFERLHVLLFFSLCVFPSVFYLYMCCYLFVIVYL